MPETQTRRTGTCAHCVRIGTCAHCVRPDIRIHARGLCDRCYQELGGYGGHGRHRTAPDPMFFEYGKLPSTADRAEDYLFMRRTDGATVEQAAARMGCTPGALYAALSRAGVSVKS